MDFEFVKTSLAAKGYDVVYDINGNASKSQKATTESQTL
jgi:hypothetical protein